jgi:hypothetical protein
MEKLKAGTHAAEVLDRTLKHLDDNKVNFETTEMVLGALLIPVKDREEFQNNAKANALLTREYRKPFVVPAESDI